MPRLSAHKPDSETARQRDGKIKPSSSLQPSACPTTDTRHPRLSPTDHLIQTVLLLAVGLTPLVFSQRATELFEFPKMALAYILALAAAWLLVIKWWQQKRLAAISTPLNWPIVIFLLWLFITALTGLHFYTSIAGYYTRFNGGLASYIAYAVLFYALVDQLVEEKGKWGRGIEHGTNQKNETQNNASITNQNNFLFLISSLFRVSHFKFKKSHMNHAAPDFPAASHSEEIQDNNTANHKLRTANFLSQLLWSWLLGASIVSIWGILEHFGRDPSCIILRGTFTANCWVEDVQARVFSTFGQPNWLATYLVATIPLGLALNLIHTSRLAKWLTAIATILCYTAFWYTYSRSGWFGLIAALVVLALAIPWQTMRRQKLWLGSIFTVCLIISLSSFSGAKLRAETALSGRGDDSSTGSIRLLVWQGTLGIIRDHPVLGTGPETFAYTFPAYRPTAANTTTEWNFLYNEAHNQALNTVATTGIPGLVIWLSLFAIPLWLLWQSGAFTNLNWLKKRTQTNETQNKAETTKQNNFLSQISSLFHASNFKFQNGQVLNQAPGNETKNSSLLNLPSILLTALAAGIIGVFISQLFGFAVVVTNLSLFVALAVISAPWAQKLEGRWKTEDDGGSTHIANTPQPSILRLPSNRFRVSNSLFLALTLILFLTSYLLFNYISAELLIKQADTETTVDPGHAIHDYQTAINRNPFEPNYRLKLAAAQINAASTNTRDQFYSQADQQLQIAQKLNPHDLIVAKSITYFYRTMASVDPTYKIKTLQAAQHSVDLAPTDADAVKTLADTQKDLGNPADALKSYTKLIQLRPTSDSYLARATYFHQFGSQDNFQQDIQKVLQMDPNNQAAKQLLQE